MLRLIYKIIGRRDVIMKKLNRKGFTLIELLAVIVILAILVAVSVPAVTKYLTTARRGTYADNAQQAVSAVRNDVISQFGASSGVTYKINAGSCSVANETTKEDCSTASGVWTPSINELLEKKLKTSPYGKAYLDTSYIIVTANADGSYSYHVCLTDGVQGIDADEEVIDQNAVKALATCPAA